MLACAEEPAWTVTVTPAVRRWETAVLTSPRSARQARHLSPAVVGVERSPARLTTVTVTPSVVSWEIAVTTSTPPASLNTPAEIAVSLSPPPLSSPDNSSPVIKERPTPPVTVTRTAPRSETAVQTMKNSVKQSRRPLSILAKDGARIKPSLCGDFQIGKVADYKEILKLFILALCYQSKVLKFLLHLNL